ncbi:MAG: SH3 domain-containing protein [Chloroflexota bacterium]
MARYKLPEDPRDSNQKRTRRLRQDSQEPIPWLWLGIGVIVTLIGIGLAISLARSILARPPLEEVVIEPTIIVLTAPPVAPPTATPPLPTPTPIPTFTPVPTPNTAVAPPEITIGFYAVVANTDGLGVTVRGGPSTSNVSLLVAPEGTLVLVLDGPQSANEFLWWQVQLDDGTEGWVAGDFLLPEAGP